MTLNTPKYKLFYKNMKIPENYKKPACFGEFGQFNARHSICSGCRYKVKCQIKVKLKKWRKNDRKSHRTRNKGES